MWLLIFIFLFCSSPVSRHFSAGAAGLKLRVGRVCSFVNIFSPVARLFPPGSASVENLNWRAETRHMQRSRMWPTYIGGLVESRLDAFGGRSQPSPPPLLVETDRSYSVVQHSVCEGLFWVFPPGAAPLALTQFCKYIRCVSKQQSSSNINSHRTTCPIPSIPPSIPPS